MIAVYWIRHQDHTDMFSQGYIGVSSNLKARFKDHKNRTENAHLKHAINKYGWDNLIKQVVIIAEKIYCLDLEKKLRPSDKIGWNIVMGGGHPPKTPWNKGKPATEEQKKFLSGLAKNRRHSEETKLQMSLTRTGQKRSKEAIEKFKIAQQAIPKRTCPHCNKTGRFCAMQRWHFDNCKLKV